MPDVESGWRPGRASRSARSSSRSSSSRRSPSWPSPPRRSPPSRPPSSSSASRQLGPRRSCAIRDGDCPAICTSCSRTAPGAPLAGEFAAWVFEGEDAVVTTPTNEEGIATLGFRASPKGGFVPVLHDLTLGHGIRAERCRVTACPADEGLMALVESPASFSVDSVEPTTLFSCSTPRSRRPHSSTPSRRSTSGFTWDAKTRSTAPRRRSWRRSICPGSGRALFSTDEVGPDPPPADVPVDRCSADDNGGPVTLTLTRGTHQATIQVFRNEPDGVLADLRQTLQGMRDANRAAQEASGLESDVAAELQVKERMLNNAFALLDLPHVDWGIPIAIASAYAELIEHRQQPRPPRQLRPEHDLFPVDTEVREHHARLLRRGEGADIVPSFALPTTRARRSKT